MPRSDYVQPLNYSAHAIEQMREDAKAFALTAKLAHRQHSSGRRLSRAGIIVRFLRGRIL